MVASDNNWSGSYGAAVITVTDSTYMSGYCGIGAYAADAAADYSIGFNGLILSGTRYYYKPIFRGGQIGEYWNGTASVPSTRFIDDCNWDTNAEYTADVGATFTSNVAYGRIIISGAGGTVWKVQPNIPTIGSGYVEYDCTSSNTTYRPIVIISDASGNGYAVDVQASAIVLSKATTFGLSNLVSYANTFIANAYMRIRFEFSPGNLKLYLNGNLIASSTDATYTPGGNVYFSCYKSSGTPQVTYQNITISALLTEVVNGSAPVLGGLAHGARYDTQEETYTTLTNPDQYGEYSLATALKTLNASTESLEMYFANTTDTTSINSDALTTLDTPLTTTAWTNYLAPILLRDQDIADTLKFSVRRKNYSGVAYDNQPVELVKYLKLAPIWRVQKYGNNKSKRK
jgi:hypothetical protein